MKTPFKTTVIVALQMMIGASAFAQAPRQPIPANDAYFAWCDQVERTLTNATRTASMLYAQTQFAEAKNVMVAAFRQSLNQTSLPGSFRPNTYKELNRSLELISILERSSADTVLKNKMIAYVALNRVDMINTVKDTLDRPFIIPCQQRGCGGRGYQTQYGAPYVDLQEFESTLASVASLQLQTAQGYSTQQGRDGRVYPLVDAATYFTIISKAAKWAAEDLSYTLFGTVFSCAVYDLQNLGTEAAQLAATVGDVYAVQYISEKVEDLQSTLNESRYGCGGGRGRGRH